MDRKIRITEGVKNEEKLLENELSEKRGHRRLQLGYSILPFK